MPFTFSHPAAVLPFALIKKKWISATGLVVGSMTPDFEYFFRMQHESYYSHTWAGMFWFDLPLGLLLVYLYNYLIRKEFIENLPVFLNRRFSAYTIFDRNLNLGKNLLFVLISLLFGILSHIIWDKLTHKTVHFFDEQENYTVFWEANSVIGAAVIAAVILNMPRGKNTRSNSLLLFWLPVVLIALLVMCLRYFSAPDIRELGISSIVGFFTGVIFICIFRKIKSRENA